MPDAELTAERPRHLSGTELRHAIAVLRPGRELRPQHAIHTSILRLTASTDKDFRTELTCGMDGIERIAHIRILQIHVHAVLPLLRPQPRQMEERIHRRPDARRKLQ